MFEDIDHWLRTIHYTPNPQNVNAYWFGIFETTEGYTLYYVGCPEYLEDDDDWTCEISYEPPNKYLPLNPTNWQHLEWNVVSDKIFEHLKNHPELLKGRFADVEAIAVGFDDGDLYRIK